MLLLALCVFFQEDDVNAIAYALCTYALCTFLGKDVYHRLHVVHLSRKTTCTIAYALCSSTLCTSLGKQRQHSFVDSLCVSMHRLLPMPICECLGHHCQNLLTLPRQCSFVPHCLKFLYRAKVIPKPFFHWRCSWLNVVFTILRKKSENFNLMKNIILSFHCYQIRYL